MLYTRNHSGSTPDLTLAYSPKCVEVEFCELRLDGVLRSSMRTREGSDSRRSLALPLAASRALRRGLALAGAARAVLRWSGAKSTTGATLRKARRAIATLGRQTLIDHDNLEAFADPVDYDRQDSSDKGVAFYASLARETGGPVLEIACGTGRVAIPIAREGLAVTGLDVVPGMLERARSKAAGLPIRWIEGDARDFDLDERFRLIFLTGNAFQAFVTNADQEALLGRVRAHLHDEGLFAFETRNPRWRTREERDEDRDGLFVDLETRAEEEARPSFTDADGREVREWRTRTYDHVAQVLHWTSYRRWHEGAQERTKITRIALRYTFPQELAALLHYNGFTVVRRYGDWDGEPLTAASPSIIVVCCKRT